LDEGEIGVSDKREEELYGIVNTSNSAIDLLGQENEKDITLL